MLYFSDSETYAFFWNSHVIQITCETLKKYFNTFKVIEPIFQDDSFSIAHVSHLEVKQSFTLNTSTRLRNLANDCENKIKKRLLKPFS